MARKTKPIKILTLDTETYNGLVGKIKRIAIYDGESVTYGYTFADVEPKIIEYSKTNQVHIYIHNAEFDLRKMPELFKQNNIIWKKSLMINNKLSSLQCKDYVIHDSYKLLPMSLSKLSKGFEVSNGKLDLWEEVQKRYQNEYSDLVDFLDRCDTEDSLYLEYLGYDVISLYEVIFKLQELSGIDLANFVKRVSTASLSRYIFKKGYKGTPFLSQGETITDYEFLCKKNWNKDLEVEEFIRKSYCGGRCEVFKPILDGVHGRHYDVNSLYPSVMLGTEYPIGDYKMYTNKLESKQIFNNWLKNHNGLGFLNCTVYIPPQNIPPLPVKMGKLTFPTGYVYGTWTYEELEYSIKYCGVEIKEYHCLVHFRNTFPVFDNFVETFYKMKEKASDDKNEALRTLAKLLLNVGYGYTGMNRDKESLDDISNMDKYDKVLYVDEEKGYIQVPADITSEYIQVQVASYVTSRARLVLLKALKKVEELGGNCYYCDTDSIVCDVELPAEMVHDTKLGLWALEGDNIKKALFLKPKVYVEVFENETNKKFKGISTDTQNEMTYETYQTILNDILEGTKDFRVIEKNKTTLRSIMYMQKNNIDFDYYETRDKKINYNVKEKREMNYNSNYTTPHHFETIQAFSDFRYKDLKKDVPFDLGR